MPDLAAILAGRGSASGGFLLVIVDSECSRSAVKLGPDRSVGPVAERDQNGAAASGRSGTNSDAGMALV